MTLIPGTRGPQIAVRAVCWPLVCVALWDGAGYAFGGPAVTSGPQYAALRLIPGGMRSWGVLLLLGAALVAWGIGQPHDRRGRRRFQWVLTGGVAYYTCWAFTVPATWLYLGSVPAWGAFTKSALIAFLYYLCARAVAAPGRREARGGVR